MPRPFPERRRAHAWLALMLLAAPGCSTHHSVSGPLIPGSIQGTVVLEVVHTDGTGAVLDTLLHPAVTGVRVVLKSGGLVVDSAFTEAGAYRFLNVAPGAYVVAVEPVSGIDWSASATVVGGTGVAAAPIVVRPVGALAISPNPASGTASFLFRVDSDANVVVEVRRLNGTVLKTLVSNVLVAGLHMVIWDGRDAAGAFAPAGSYHVVVRGEVPPQSALVDEVPPPGDVIGTVVAEGSATNASGTVAGPMIAADLDGITVRLFGTGLAESTLTVGGRYRFDRVPPGSYVVRADVTPTFTSTQYATLSADSVVVPAIELKSTPTMKAWPNPFATVVEFSDSISNRTLVGTTILTANGHVVRVTSSDLFGPGLFYSAWTGIDDQGVAVPAGYYWAMVDRFLGASSRTLVKLERP